MSETVLLVLGLGFALGLKHATDTDHVVAVTSILSEHLSLWRAGLVGLLWGVGHTASLLAVGAAIVFLRVAIPAPVAALLELTVALMIVFLGGRILYVLLRGRGAAHVHRHVHGGSAHSHLRFHDRDDAHDLTRPHEHVHDAPHGERVGVRPLIVGLVHGLAGSAALTLLVLTDGALRGSRALGMVYLFAFGIGSVGGMVAMSVLLSLPFLLTSARFERVNVPLRVITGIGGVLFGLYYAWSRLQGA